MYTNLSIYTPGKYFKHLAQANPSGAPGLKLQIPSLFNVICIKKENPTEIYFGPTRFQLKQGDRVLKEGLIDEIKIEEDIEGGLGIASHHYTVEIKPHPNLPPKFDRILNYQSIIDSSPETLRAAILTTGGATPQAIPLEFILDEDGWEDVPGFKNTAACVRIDPKTNEIEGLHPEGYLSNEEAVNALKFIVFSAWNHDCVVTAVKILCCWREAAGYVLDVKAFNSAMRVFEEDKSRLLGMYKSTFQTNLDGEYSGRKYFKALKKWLCAHPDEEVHRIARGDKGSILASALIEIARNASNPSLQAIADTGIDYEKKVGERLAELGFQVRATAVTGDFGADLIVEKDDLIYVIQCKLTQRPVGIKAVQEAIAARKYYRGDFSVVVGQSDFTSAARELAIESNVILLDSNYLDRLEALAL